MSSTSFIPRTVKRRKVEVPSAQGQVSLNFVASERTIAGAATASEDHPPPKDIDRTSPVEAPEAETSAQGQEAGRSKDARSSKPSKSADLEELAFLVWLSLSDHALWLDADLRRKLTSSSKGSWDAEEGGSLRDDDRSYVPLAYLRRHSPIFHAASFSADLVNQPETLYVKALRAHASDLVDVRLIVTNDGVALRGSYWPKQPSATAGYEVRRKLSLTMSDTLGRADWERLTLYLENIPHSFRCLPGVAKLVSLLLPSPSLSKIQAVSFLPHHNDHPGSIPACKGFALVTLSNSEDTESFLQEWPWDIRKRQAGKERETPQEPLAKEACKYGLRALSKKRWEELKAEYLLFRQQLVEELNAENATQQKISRQPDRQPQHHVEIEPLLEAPDTRKATPPVQADAPFPPGCLVFVRNVHPETNKTTLRTLFSQAWNAEDASLPSSSAAALDYVDYAKGLDTCHLRLRSPMRAEQLVRYFTEHPTIQTSGLDGQGTGCATSEAIVPELVLGRREELYWEKVPEKVRRQAVEKALGGLGGDGEMASSGVKEASTGSRKNRRKK